MTRLHPLFRCGRANARAACRIAACLTAVALVTSILASFAVWLRVSPGAADWTVRVPVGIGTLRVPIEVSVYRLLDAVTDPSWARWLDARRLQTPLGPLDLRWNGDTLSASCAPCRIAIGALGDARVDVVSATLTVRRDGANRYRGEIVSGAVHGRWSAVAARASLALRGDLEPTPIAALYATLGDAVPEARRARIDGTFAARVALDLPAGRWSIDARSDDFAVEGLGTEALRYAEAPAQCRPAAARVSRWLERAVIAAEDQRFFEHQGFDPVEVQHALDGNQQRDRRRRGASTLDQQLARLLYTGDAPNVVRKARELLYAVEMDRTLGKARVLGLYLRLAPWGEGACGSEGAARRYFGKSAAALDPLEAAWLAARLRAPDAPRRAVTTERVVQVLRAMRGLPARERAAWIERASSDARSD